jgi:tetratricopeptide (TPR) repeat protein
MLESAGRVLREANLPAHHVLTAREILTHAQLLMARRRNAEARDLLGRAASHYEAQNCCRAHIALTLAQRAELEIAAGELAAAEADAKRAVSLAPPREGASASRFTGNAWLATGRVQEAAGRLREARDSFAIAAAEFSGALGDGHPETLRARAAIDRAAGGATTKYHD